MPARQQSLLPAVPHGMTRAMLNLMHGNELSRPAAPLLSETGHARETAYLRDVGTQSPANARRSASRRLARMGLVLVA